MAGGSKHAGRSVISKISAIVLAVSEGGGRTLTEIATRSDLPLSTVHRLVTELAAWRVLERDSEGRYRAGASLGKVDGCSHPFPVAGPVRTDVGVRERGARHGGPVPRDRRPRASGILDRTAVVYVEKASAHRPVSWPFPAARLPAHATALGKAVLAFSPPLAVDAVLAHGLTRYTPTTVTSSWRSSWGCATWRRTCP